MKSIVGLMVAGVMASIVSSAVVAQPPFAPRGIYHARETPGSPTLLASGMVWTRDGLLIADRREKRIVRYRPNGGFETLHKLTQPFGVALDPMGRMLVSEKIDANHILRLGDGGMFEELVGVNHAGTPHALAVHRNGTIYWTGFPDGGTRSRTPDGKVTIHSPKIGHTFGIVLNGRQDWLYVTSKLPDRDRRAVWRFPVADDGTLGVGEPFFYLKDLRPNLPDLPVAKDGGDTLVGWIGRIQGIALDSTGNFYIGGAESHTSGSAVAVISPDGKNVRAMILDVPRNIASLTFSVPESTLYIAGAGEYRLHEMRFSR